MEKLLDETIFDTLRMYIIFKQQFTHSKHVTVFGLYRTSFIPLFPLHRAQYWVSDLDHFMPLFILLKRRLGE